MMKYFVDMLKNKFMITPIVSVRLIDARFVYFLSY